MSREALVLLVCCCDFRDGAEWLIPSKSLRNAVIWAFPGLLCILRMCAPRRAAAVVRPRGREKSADRRRRILISRLLIIRASVPRWKSPFPAYFKGFPAVSPLIPPYPAFLKYPVSPHYCTSIAKNILGNHEDTEECVNDTYLNAWNSMPPHRPSILSTFLGKIVRNLSFNRYKHNTADKRGGGELPVVLEELSDLVSGKDDVGQAFDQKELTKAIDTFLDSLSPEKRSIFISRYWYTDSISEIAVRHGMNDGAVSMTLNRLRLKLHNYLLERGFEL